MLGLMRKFELCFRFPDPRDDTYLIPQLLGKEQPALGEEFQRKVCLNFQYTYPIWPEGLIPRFIAVSYTHLDVYKRQDRGQPRERNRVDVRWKRILFLRDHRKRSQQQDTQSDHFHKVTSSG